MKLKVQLPNQKCPIHMLAGASLTELNHNHKKKRWPAFFMSITISIGSSCLAHASGKLKTALPNEKSTSPRRAFIRMELSKTDFDVDLDQCDTDIPWLKTIPRSVEGPFMCDICCATFMQNRSL